MPFDPHQALTDQFQQLVGETSRRFVPQPSLEEVIADMGIMLKRFSNNCRWAEVFFTKQAAIGNIEDHPEDDQPDLKSLGTDVRPLKTINAQAPLGSTEMKTSSMPLIDQFTTTYGLTETSRTDPMRSYRFFSELEKRTISSPSPPTRLTRLDLSQSQIIALGCCPKFKV